MQKRTKTISTLFAVILLLSFLILPAHAESVNYAAADSDFTTAMEIPDTYTILSTGASIEQTLVLEKGGGAAWKALAINNDAPTAPQVGDVLHAKLTLYISEDADLSGGPVMKIAGYNSSWADGRDYLHLDQNQLETLPRGKLVTVCDESGFDGGLTQHWDRTIHDGTNGGFLQIELHNDMTAGTVEIVALEIWATRQGKSVVYDIGDFKQWDAADNGATKPYAQSVLKLDSGAAISKTIAVDATDEHAPHPADTVSAALTCYRCADGAILTLSVSDGVNTLCSISNAAQTVGSWDKFPAQQSQFRIADGAQQLTVTLQNTGNDAVRIKSYELAGTRLLDFTADGVLDEADAAAMEQALAQGSKDLQYDLDADGQFTAKDISYLRKFLLHDAGEFYLNLSHFDFLSEEITIDGKQMIVMNLYAEPNDRNDLSMGYHYVGDAQEGFACLDDTARAVVALAEHYRLYHDDASLQEIKGMLEFVLYMQEDDGEFRNFIAKDSSGNYYKRDSASSYKAFSYWAARGYTALAYGYEALGSSDPALSARVKAAMDLCANRVSQEINKNYGKYSGSLPAWNIAGDNAVSANVISASAKHYALSPDNTTVLRNIQRLGEAIAASAAGDMTTYPFGAIMHGSDRWDEWGSTQIAALALAGEICGNNDWINTASLAADSFLTDLLISGRAFCIAPTKQSFPHINYGTASYVDNLLTLYNVTGQTKYAQWAGIAASWWTGNNASDEQIPMFNQDYGLAFDGIVSASDVSTNSGAESVVEAVRALARVLQNETASALLYAQKTDASTATTLEGETIYYAGADVEYPLENGGLNDVAQANIVKQSTDPGLDETQSQTAETVLPEAVRDTWAEVYSNWQGKNAFFCQGTGYDNIRLYQDGSLVTTVAVGADGQLQAGDYVMLDFMALVQFDTNLRAEVFAVDADGNETLIADDSQMVYLARTWYSGSNSVKTRAIAPIPAGTEHLKIQFSVTTSATAEDYGKAYATITQAKLFRLMSAEIQSGGSAYSQGSYALMRGKSSKTFQHTISEAGAYDIYLSVGAVSDAGAEISLFDETSGATISAAAAQEDGVQIIRLGRIHLDAGSHTFVLTNHCASDVNFDCLIFYPKVTYTQYQTPSGVSARIERDSGDAAVQPPKPSENPRPTVPTAANTGASSTAGSAPVAGLLFTDVTTGHWFYQDVAYVYEAGLMNGVGAGNFAPDCAVSRGMMMTVLARMAHADTAGGTPWYAKAAAWAMAQTISDGTNPDADLTREQLAVMLWRYAGRPESDTTLDFPDAGNVSSWAQEAMRWAVSQGLICGMQGYLRPQGTATRAQLAAILHRFCQSAV